jgi:vacuolar-type H+-ATPase subunit I/STV1
MLNTMPKYIFSLLFLLTSTMMWSQLTQQEKLEQRKAQILREIKEKEDQLQNVQSKEKKVTKQLKIQTEKIKLKENLINTTEKQTNLLSNDMYINQMNINNLIEEAEKYNLFNNNKIKKVSISNVSQLHFNMLEQNGFTIQEDGLVIGEVSNINNDLQIPIPDDLKKVSENLKRLIESLPEQGISERDIPIMKPYEYEDATWVSNRWVELLDIPLIDKQRLMQIDSPIVRLELINDAIN